MKRVFTIITLICLASFCADAQWYLFPGKKNKNKNKKEKPVVEVKVDTVSAADTATTFEEIIENTIEDAMYFFDPAPQVGVALALPLNLSGPKPSNNFLDMYCGALIALRDLGESGLKVKLNVLDTSKDSLTVDIIRDNDIIIGPISYKDISAIAGNVPDNRVIISPLEPRAAELVDSCNIVQSPVPWYRQIDVLAEWIAQDTQVTDQIIVISDNGAYPTGQQASRLLGKLRENKLMFNVVRSLNDVTFEENLHYRVVVATDSDSFLAGATRSAAIAAQQYKNITLYSTSRVRSNIGDNVSDLYNANTRLTTAYYIDYNSQEVKDFVIKYRSFFHNEPGQFAFQGYDIVKYFVKMCDSYGRRWHKKLPELSQRGLQSDFKFEEESGHGRINTAVRKVIYNNDLTQTLVK